MTDDIEVARYALRTFRVDYGILKSVSFKGDCWTNGVCEAECEISMTLGYTPHHGPVPELGCSCGIYGSLSVEHLVEQFARECGDLITVIAAEGQTIIGPRGLRTQYARVVAYWSPWRSVRKMCRRQFLDACSHRTLDKMLDAYLLPFEATPVDDDDIFDGYWA